MHTALQIDCSFVDPVDADCMPSCGRLPKQLTKNLAYCGKYGPKMLKTKQQMVYIYLPTLHLRKTIERSTAHA